MASTCSILLQSSDGTRGVNLAIDLPPSCILRVKEAKKSNEKHRLGNWSRRRFVRIEGARRTELSSYRCEERRRRMYTYVYMHIESERERERETDSERGRERQREFLYCQTTNKVIFTKFWVKCVRHAIFEAQLVQCEARGINSTSTCIERRYTTFQRFKEKGMDTCSIEWWKVHAGRSWEEARKDTTPTSMTVQ